MFGRKKKKAYVVAVDMGYGHQRAALPLRDIAKGGIITANAYKGIPKRDKNVWEDSRRFYEIVSRFKKFPVLGDFVFAIFDKFQEIKDFYPAQEHVEAPTLQIKQVYRLIKEKAWGKHLIEQLNRRPLPFVTTFFIPAYMAEYWGYKGKIYLVIPDTDVSRAWAPLAPTESGIIYCASTERVVQRLIRYGVQKENIVQTGFPLPQEFTKNNAAKAKRDLRRRLAVLDPNNEYISSYKKLIEQHVGGVGKQQKKTPVNLTFAIGGAGAQAEVAEQIMRNLQALLRDKTVRFHIIAGVHQKLAASVTERAKELGLGRELKKSIYIHEASSKKKYFQTFADILSQTDVLWTKPSELVFYAGLGVPIIIAPPIGSQEKCNRQWLLQKGAGIDQKSPELVADWFPDLLEKGLLAKAALQGFVEIPRNGAENIKELVLKSEARSTKSETNSNG